MSQEVRKKNTFSFPLKPLASLTSCPAGSACAVKHNAPDVWEACVRVCATSRCQQHGNISILSQSYFWLPAVHGEPENHGSDSVAVKWVLPNTISSSLPLFTRQLLLGSSLALLEISTSGRLAMNFQSRHIVQDSGRKVDWLQNTFLYIKFAEVIDIRVEPRSQRSRLKHESFQWKSERPAGGRLSWEEVLKWKPAKFHQSLGWMCTMFQTIQWLPRSEAATLHTTAVYWLIDTFVERYSAWWLSG